MTTKHDPIPQQCAFLFVVSSQHTISDHYSTTSKTTFPNCLQRLPATDDTSRQGVKVGVVFGKMNHTQKQKTNIHISYSYP